MVTHVNQDMGVFGVLWFGQYLGFCLYSNVIMDYGVVLLS